MTLIETLDAARRAQPDRDPKQVAVSDLFACDRRTWHRRNGYVEPPFTDALLRKFSIGLAVEAEHARLLREAGIPVKTGLRVALRVEEGVLRSRDLRETDVPLAGEVTGHPDLWLPLEGTLVEVKTTDVRKPKDECDPHYALQASAYALALDADRTVVHVTHIVPFEKPEVEYEVYPEEHRSRVIQRIVEVLESTAPGAPMPPAEPPRETAAFACKYCQLAQCERNANPDATVVEIPEDEMVLL